MNAQVPINETGKASAGMTVAEADFKKTKMTAITSTTDSISVCCTSLIDWRIETERSLRILTPTEGGNCDW